MTDIQENRTRNQYQFGTSFLVAKLPLAEIIMASENGPK